MQEYLWNRARLEYVKQITVIVINLLIIETNETWTLWRFVENGREREGGEVISMKGFSVKIIIGLSTFVEINELLKKLIIDEII